MGWDLLFHSGVCQWLKEIKFFTKVHCTTLLIIIWLLILILLFLELLRVDGDVSCTWIGKVQNWGILLWDVLFCLLIVMLLYWGSFLLLLLMWLGIIYEQRTRRIHLLITNATAFSGRILFSDINCWRCITRWCLKEIPSSESLLWESALRPTRSWFSLGWTTSTWCSLEGKWITLVTCNRSSTFLSLCGFWSFVEQKSL